MTPDPGRQPERTRLAWRRTVLGFTVVALLAGRLAVLAPEAPLAPLALATVLLGWLGLLVLSWRRIVATSTVAPAPVRRAVPLTAWGTVGFAAVGIALVVVDW